MPEAMTEVMPHAMAEAAPATLAPMLVADHPALDFLNSRASPAGVEFEWLSDMAGLLGWLVAARMGPSVGLDAVESDEDVAVRARALREWLRGFVTKHAGHPLGTLVAQDFAPLNDVLAQDCAHRQIVIRSEGAAWSPALRHDPASSLLQPLATAAGDLI